MKSGRSGWTSPDRLLSEFPGDPTGSPPAGRHRRLLPDRPPGLGEARRSCGRPASSGIYPRRSRAKSVTFVSMTPKSRGKSCASRPTCQGLVAADALTRCDASNEEERVFRPVRRPLSLGWRRLCLALAEERGWTVATDDRKAIRVAGQAGLSSFPVPSWSKPGPMRRSRLKPRSKNSSRTFSSLLNSDR